MSQNQLIQSNYFINESHRPGASSNRNNHKSTTATIWTFPTHNWIDDKCEGVHMFPTITCWSINVSRYSMCIQIDMKLSQVSYFKCLNIEHWTHQQKMSIVEHFNGCLFAMLKIVSILLLFTSFRIDILNEEVIVTYYSLFTSTSSSICIFAVKEIHKIQ